MAAVADVTDQNFESEVLKSKIPVLVDFWAEWCGPCRAIAPIIKDLAARYGEKLKVVKMNVDENQSIPARYGVRSIPLVLAIKDGAVVDQILGSKSKEAFDALAKKIVA